MARTSLENLTSLQDPAQSWNFDLLFPTIPGSSSTRNLTFKCQTTEMPGKTIEKVEVPLHGIVLSFAGRETFTHSLPVTMIETADWSTRNDIMNWSLSIRNMRTNRGTIASQYKVKPQIVVYNDIPEVMRTCNLVGCWPEVVTEVPLDGTASNLITLQFQLCYDYWYDE